MLTVADVATRYGIRLLEVEDIAWFKAGLRTFDPGLIGNPTDAAAGCLQRRVVVCKRDEHHECPHVVLHEIMHLVLTPQKRWTGVSRGAALQELDEAFVLLQVEREVARLLGKDVYRRVVEWQRKTGTPILEGSMSDRSHMTDAVWLGGYALARRLGVLDDENRPTWRWPRWSRGAGRAAVCAMNDDRDGLLRAYADMGVSA